MNGRVVPSRLFKKLVLVIDVLEGHNGRTAGRCTSSDFKAANIGSTCLPKVSHGIHIESTGRSMRDGMESVQLNTTHVLGWLSNLT